MKKIIVAPVDPYMDDLYVGVREFETEKVILISPEKDRGLAEKIKKDLEKFILKELNKPICCNSLEELSKKLNMSLPLVSYHVNGTLKSKGLKELGLVETRDIKGKTEVKITAMGRMLLKGYIE